MSLLVLNGVHKIMLRPQ